MKSGQKCWDFEWSIFKWLGPCYLLLKLKPDPLKSVLEKIWISNVSRFQMVKFQIPTIIKTFFLSTGVNCCPIIENTSWTESCQRIPGSEINKFVTKINSDLTFCLALNILKASTHVLKGLLDEWPQSVSTLHFAFIGVYECKTRLQCVTLTAR